MVVELAKLGVCGWLVSSLDGAFGSQHGQHWRRTRAAAETAGCRLGRRRSRRKEQKRWMRRRVRAPAAAPIGKVSSLWVGLSVSRSGGRSGLVRRSISRLGLCLVGSSVRAGALCFRGLGIRIFLSPPLFVCGGRSAAVCLCAFWRNSSVEEPPCSSLPFSRSFSSALAR